jgi:TetR/AcrR family transcriptional repressor of mexJK operon
MSECVATAGCHQDKRGKRRAAMIEAAQQLFAEKGFDATTLGDIVGRSGGSLATLYDLFENKTGLLRAMVCEKCGAIDDALDRAVAAHQPPSQVLRAIGEEMLSRLFAPAYVGMFRVVAAQCAAQPDLGRQLYDAGPAACQAKGAEYLAAQKAAGTLAVDDPLAASRLFFQMVCGHYHSRLVFGLDVDLPAAERKRHLDYVVSAFLKIHQPEQQATATS